jgi:hypothetical protein
MFEQRNEMPAKRVKLTTVKTWTEKVFLIDILPIVFKFQSSPKDLIRLEFVSKTSQQCARTVEAWSRIISLVVESDKDQNFFVNGNKVSDIVPVVRSVLIRHPNLKRINLLNCYYLNIYDLVDVIRDSGVLSKLQEMYLNADESILKTEYLGRLIDVFKNQLTYLNIRNLSFENKSDAKNWWTVVTKCSKLKKFIFHQEPDATTTANMIEY